MPRARCRVVKLGGSLLRSTWIWPRLGDWLLRDAREHQVVVTGGGEWADGIRRLDADAGLAATEAHWLAVRAMSLTAWTFTSLHPDFRYLDRMSNLERELVDSSRPALFVFDTADWLQEEERRQLPDRLPLGWNVTSDSIAARLATRLDAEELLLLKSTAGAIEAMDAPDEGEPIVDDYFPVAARGVQRVRVVNLREAMEHGETGPKRKGSPLNCGD